MGAAMGGNTMNQTFGGQGADKLLVRTTTVLAVIFMLLAISIQWFGKSSDNERFDETTQSLPALNVNDEEPSSQDITLPGSTTE